MAEWIGHLIANWPIVLVLPIAIIAGILFTFSTSMVDAFFPTRKEWWQDRQKRIEKELTTKKAKAKKG